MKTFFSRPKVRIGLISILLALLIAFFFLIPRNSGPYRAVPSQTSVLIEFNGLVKAGQQLKLVSDTTWTGVLKAAIFQNCWTEIGDVEQMFHHDAAARVAFAKNRLLAACSLHPADSLHPLFILDMGAANGLHKILENNALKYKFFPYQFHSQTLYTVHLSKNERVVVARKGQLLIFSRYSYLVEDALTQLEQAGSWWSDNQYLGDLAPEAGFKVFFRPSKWLAQHQGDLLPEARGIPETVSANVAWLGFAWNGKNVTALGESTGFLAGSGAWNGAEHGDIFSVFPDNTAFFAWAGFDNRSLFYKAITDKQSVDFEHFVLPWAGTSAALVVTEPLSAALSDDRLLILSVSDSAKVQRALLSYGETRGLIAHEQVGMFDIFGFQSASLLAPFFPDGDPAFQNPYFAHLGKYVVVAPNRPGIENFVEKYIGSQTLAQNTDFLQLMQHFGPKGRGLLVWNSGYLPRMLQQVFQPAAPQKNWASDVQRIAKAGWVAIALEPGIGRKLEIKVAAQKQTFRLPESNIFWKTNLDAPVATGIVTIPQPGMAMGTAILVQDHKTELYCIQPDGTIAWQRHLGELLMPPIKAIDYFQNGRKCYLFNTTSQVWVLDENGANVSGYPLALKAPANTSLTVADFDKNLKFNYFITSGNGNVYGFDLYGRALEGWNPQAGVGKAAGPLLHFQHQAKDYLAVLNEQGLLTVFARDGKARFAPFALQGKFSSPPFFDQTAGKGRIVCISDAGVLYACGLDGQQAQRLWSANSQSAPARVAQLHLEGQTSYAVLQGNQLTIVRLTAGKAQKVFSHTFQERPDDVFAGEGGVGVCVRGKRKMMLFDHKGNLVKGFPLAGNTPFGTCTVGAKKLVISGNGSAVLAYKMEN